MKAAGKLAKGAGTVADAATNKSLLNAASGATTNKGIKDLVSKAMKNSDKAKNLDDAAEKAGDLAKASKTKADDLAKASKKADKAKRMKRIKKTAAYGVAAGVGLGYINDRFASDVNKEARAECERACQPVMGTRVASVPADLETEPVEDGASDAATGKPFNLCGEDALAYPDLDDFVKREGVHREGDDDEGTPVADLAPDDPKRVAVLENLKCVSCAEGHRPTDEDFMYETYEGDALALRDYCTPVCADKCLGAYPVQNVGPVEKAIAAVKDLFERLWNFDITDAFSMVGWAALAVASLRVSAPYGKPGKLLGIMTSVYSGYRVYNLLQGDVEEPL